MRRDLAKLLCIALLSISTGSVGMADGFTETNLADRVVYSERVKSVPQLRGTMSPGGLRCTEQDVADLAALGATVIRYQLNGMSDYLRQNGREEQYDHSDISEKLAIWDEWLSKGLERFDQAICWARKHKMRLVLDLHAPPGDRGLAYSRESSMFFDRQLADHFVETWRKMAIRYRGNSDVIFGYDLVNEPLQRHEALPGCSNMELQKRAADAIRAVDRETTIIVECGEFGNPEGFKGLKPIGLPNVIYSCHMYRPHQYTHQSVPTNEASVASLLSYPSPNRRFGGGKQFPLSKDGLRGYLGPVREFQLKYGARIFIGEFSAPNYAPGADLYMEDCINLFNEFGWDWVFHVWRENRFWDVEKIFNFETFSLNYSTNNARYRVLTDGFRCKPKKEKMKLKIVSDSARAKARNFIERERQFQLGFLPTEQSNPITATLEEDFKRSTLAGVQCLQRGDRQMPITMRHVFAGKRFAKLVDSMVETVTGTKGRIIFSGCGATGRLSILLESMWRDFFHRRAAELTEEERELADRSASIMTGGDFALIRSVEFFEDYAEGGRRQAAALEVGEGDTFVAITEGGETSSVLGTLKYAAEHGAKCFLVFNNPADLLRGYLDRCREAIDNPKVTVIDLYCGSMSVAGSTRMQATSSEQLLCSCALEAALCRVLPRFTKETAADYTVAFEQLLSGLESKAGRKMIADEIEFEKGVYEKGGRITYLADKCMLDLFTDNTERAPTFMIPPLRSSREKAFAQSWAFVKNPLHPTEECWSEMMRRHPRCLEFTSEDARSLGMPQNFIDNPPHIKYSDLITYMIGNEPALERIEGYARAAAVVLNVPGSDSSFADAAAKMAAAWPERRDFTFAFPIADSPLEIWKHLAVKLAFNCLSTGTMAEMGRIAGNWMSWVSMSNKKLIDRCIRLLVELGHVDYETSAQIIFSAEEWIAAQDWTKTEEPSPVQVALEWVLSGQIQSE